MTPDQTALTAALDLLSQALTRAARQLDEQQRRIERLERRAVKRYNHSRKGKVAA